ncbi:MAG: hypothetical protein A2Z72_02025 [Omnitrophica bacterium RBG_13_46_9]|nr:MAG: hypothetical protein A2Z72_02025 [Omnitrophica bacterium RBG_13_46_9]
MRRIITIVVAIVFLAAGAYLVIPKYALFTVGNGVVKYNRFTGRSWRLNLADGIWHEMEDFNLDEQEKKKKEETK